MDGFVRVVCENTTSADGFPESWDGKKINLYRAYRFFKATHGVAKNCLALAKAEQRAKEIGLIFTWEADEDYDWSDHVDWCKEARKGKAALDGAPVEDFRVNPRFVNGVECNHEIEGCVVYAPGDGHGEQLASLWGIIDADRRYRRVVEAELAMEALDEWDRRQAIAANDAQLRGEARELYGDDNVTVENDAEVSRSEDGSIRVQAWVRVPRQES